MPAFKKGWNHYARITEMAKSNGKSQLTDSAIKKLIDDYSEHGTKTELIDIIPTAAVFELVWDSQYPHDVIRFSLFDSGGGMAVSITRMELDASGLRRAAAQSRNSDASRRMLALALVLEGRPRTEAAVLCGMDRQTLRDWVHRYNDLGLAGLSSRIPPGPKPRLTSEQEAEVARLVQEGPSLSEHGVVRWRRIDLSHLIKTRFGIHLAERSVGDLLRRLGFRRLSARPRHTGHDATAQEAHKKTSPIWSPLQSRSTPVANQSNSGGKTKRGSASRER